MGTVEGLDRFTAGIARLARENASIEQQLVFERALILKEGVIGAAASRTRFADVGGFASFTPPKRGPRGAFSLLRLRSGFGHLAQLGSYKSPGGYEIVPKKVTNRRIRSAARRGQTLTARRALSTPYGTKARVFHPPQTATPFWSEGIRSAAAAAAAMSYRTYRRRFAAAMKIGTGL